MADCRRPFEGSTSAEDFVAIDHIERVAGGVAYIQFTGGVTLNVPGFAGETNLDINGHTALTLNTHGPGDNVVQVNTGGGTTVGQPWTLSGELAWIQQRTIFPNAGLIL